MQRCPSKFLLFAPALSFAGTLLCASVAIPAPAGSPTARRAAPPAPRFERDVALVVSKYCIGCHSGATPSGGIRLGTDATLTAMLAHSDLWDRVAANIDNRHMPPEGVPAPTAAERATLVGYVQTTLAQADCKLHDPGRPTARRLNRVEYDNTIRDLTGLDLKLSADFPSDDVGYGFDNIGDVLSLSPLLMEKYLTAAGKVAHAAITAPEDRRGTPVVKGTTISGTDMTGAGSVYEQTGGFYLSGSGEAGADYDFPAAGRYRFRVVAWEQKAGADHAQMAIRFGGKTLQTVAVNGTQDKASSFVVPIDVPAKGTQRLSIAFLNDYYNVDSPDPKMRGDRNLIVQSFRIVPTESVVIPAPPVSAASGRIVRFLPAAPTEAARALATRRNMTAFALRAYRRPPTPAEIDRLCHVAALARAQGGSFEAGMQYAVQAALVSPNFLFRFESDARPGDRAAHHLVSDYELATRLSYFLWSTMPDDRLFDLASRGRLHDPVVLKAEAHRMLADTRSTALADNFAAQWLTLRKLQNVAPDPARFPEWNDALRSAMRTETLMYFNGIMRGDRSVLEFLDSNYTYLNEPLARLYGNTEVMGNEFRRVALRSGQRGGVLTQASVLTVTSNPTRTSPVKRGKWVMENLLGIAIPAPPPGVGQLPDDKKAPLVGTLRQRMEQHRINPACANCHAQMDPIGFGLENFNAIGKWRTLDDGAPIDASGKLPGGGPAFDGPGPLRAVLKAKAPLFVHNLSEKMLTYALGRGLESYDRCNVDTIAANVTQHDYKFSSLIEGIVASDPFRYRRGDPGTGKPARVADR
jgi:hypothetical protein